MRGCVERAGVATTSPHANLGAQKEMQEALARLQRHLSRRIAAQSSSHTFIDSIRTPLSQRTHSKPHAHRDDQIREAASSPKDRCARARVRTHYRASRLVAVCSLATLCWAGLASAVRRSAAARSRRDDDGGWSSTASPGIDQLSSTTSPPHTQHRK